jgi:hypothetical protein
MKLQPTQVTEETLGDVVYDGVRQRPTIAKRPDGKLVVCAARTARKHGWAIQEKLFVRPAAPAKPKAEQRKADLKAVEEMLGKPKAKKMSHQGKKSILKEVNKGMNDDLKPFFSI